MAIFSRKKYLQEVERQVEAGEEQVSPAGFQVIVREFKKDRLARFSLYAVVTFMLFVFISALFISPEMYTKVEILRKYDPPSFKSVWDILGRDPGGRSVLAYLIVGARNSIFIGFCITIITTCVGVMMGLIMGFYGGKVDSILMRIIDFIGVLPMLIMIISIVSIMPNLNTIKFILILSAFYWVGTARLVRAKALSEARRDYISASKTMGTSDLKIMLTSLLPNISSIIIVDSTLALAGNIGVETSLSFLGFGLPVTVPSLGTLIAYASKPEVIQYKFFVWLPATFTILFMMLSINYVGQALRRASDAKQRLG